MLKKFFTAFCILSLIFITSSQLEAASIKVGVLRFESSAELLKKADLVTNTFIKVLSDSNSITVLNRLKTDNISANLKAVSDFGKTEGCQYMLIGSVNRDKDIVINVRAVEVETAKILFSMSVVDQTFDDNSLSANTMTLGNRVRERLTGEYPEVSSVKGKDININRGSSSGIRKGDLYIVRQEFANMIDKDGKTVGRNAVDLAIVEIKSVQKDSSVANIYKKAGSTTRLHTLINQRIEPVSKKEADNLIRQKTFSFETIKKNADEAQDNLMSIALNPNTPPSTELEIMQKEAEKGNPIAQGDLGTYYLSRKNFPLALKWLQEAARHNYIYAQNNLGFMYAQGLGVPVNYQKAFELFMKSAEKGNAMAQSNVGSMYENGEGVKQDYKKAIIWYEKAAKQGNSDALIHLAMLYEDGKGVKKDIEKAISLYTQAAAQNDAIAMINLGLITSKTDKRASREWYRKALEQGQKDNNEEIIKIARDRLAGLENLENSGAGQYIEAAEKGDAVAQYNLALSYEEGKEVKQDYKKAFEWYSKSAKKGYMPAQTSLGVMYAKGLGLKQDYKKAFEWYSKAAQKGYSVAQYNLAVMYEFGHGLKQDYKKAAEWYEKAAKQGYAPAQSRLSFLYMLGQGVNQDNKKALELCNEAIQSGYVPALNNLALMYEFGIGVPKDIKKAIELYSYAANQGDETAKTNLQRMARENKM